MPRLEQKSASPTAWESRLVPEILTLSALQPCPRHLALWLGSVSRSASELASLWKSGLASMLARATVSRSDSVVAQTQPKRSQTRLRRIRRQTDFFASQLRRRKLDAPRLTRGFN